jgi:hypothetical protein
MKYGSMRGQAVRNAAIIEQRRQGALYREIGAVHGLSTERARQIVHNAEGKARRRRAIGVVWPSARCANVVKRITDRAPDDSDEGRLIYLCSLTGRDILRTAGVGFCTAEQIKVTLADMGLHLRCDAEWVKRALERRRERERKAKP